LNDFINKRTIPST